MQQDQPTFLTKFRWSLPWLMRYPWSRAKSFFEQTAFEKKHIIITVANHFEPGWSQNGILDHKTQMTRLREYRNRFRVTAESVLDADGTRFRYTNFYPAEQYHPEILEIMAEIQAEDLGDSPDTADNVRRTLLEFRATGCYADMTLPSAPDQSQVAVINQIYECGLPLERAVPHRQGNRVAANGKTPSLPLIFTGPLVFNWTRRVAGLPFPRLDDGALTANQPLDFERFNRWRSANITVAGKSDWVFVKLYCHGFFDRDQPNCIGDNAKRFFSDLVERSDKSGEYQLHFASAREAFNIASAAIDGKTGEPGEFRNYRLRSIMQNGSK